MSYKNITAAVAAFALATIPTIASAAPQNAATTSSMATSTRASTVTKDKSHLSRGAIIGIVLSLGVIAGGIIAISNNDDDNNRPTSP